MSYVRGRYYIWSDGTHLHLWAVDGLDHWQTSGWYEGRKETEKKWKPSGVRIPDEVVDEYVVMRFAQLTCDGRLEDTLDRAMKSGNAGGMALKMNQDKLRRVIAEAKLGNPFPWLDIPDAIEARKGKISRVVSLQLKKLCADQGLNWDAMSKSERQAFIRSHIKAHPLAKSLEFGKKLKKRARKFRKE